MEKVKIFALLIVGVMFIMCSCGGEDKSSDNLLYFKSPVSGQTVSLAGPDVKSFIDDYYLGYSLDFIDKTKGDHYYPTACSFEWESVEGGRYFFYISQDEDFSDCVAYETSEPRISIDNLFVGKTYYYKIEETVSGRSSGVKCFYTASTPRTLKISGISNTRDMGGYSTFDGKKVRQGMVFRGATPENATAEGLKEFSKLGVKTIIDLRETYGRTRSIDGVTYAELPEKGGPCYVNGTRAITIEEYKQALVRAIAFFADESNYPVYFHCQIGRDRTGTLAFILNGLLGVDYSDLTKDFELSCFSTAGCIDYDDATKQVERMVRDVEDMRLYFKKYAAKKYGGENELQFGIEAFLIDGGVSESQIAAIKRIMLE